MKFIKAALLFLLIQAMAIPLMAAAANADSPVFRGSRVGAPETVTDVYNWTGIYVGGGIGGSWLDGELRGTAFGNVPQEEGPVEIGEIGSAIINGLSGRGLTGDVRLGFDWRLPNSPFLIGVLGGYQFGTIEHESSLTFGPTTFGAQLEIEPTWYVGGRVGLIFHQKVLTYVGYAYTQANLDLSFSGFTPGNDPCSAPTNFRCSHEVDGHMILAGVEFALAAGWTMGAEYNYTMYDTARLFDGRNEAGQGIVADFESDVHSVKLRLNWRPLSLF